MPGWGTDAPVTSQEQADLDDMGEKVLHESTFPAAPLVRPPVMLPPVLAHTSTCAETLITTASPSDFVRVSPTVATSLVT